MYLLDMSGNCIYVKEQKLSPIPEFCTKIGEKYLTRSECV